METSAKQKIREQLQAMQDPAYRDFQAKLIPSVAKETVIGVRTPLLRAYAKKLCKEEPQTAACFLQGLPHTYYEENNLHGLLIGQSAKTPQEALERIDVFLPYVDNWATCDMLPPKIFQADLPLVRSRILPWLAGEETYRVRFAIVTMLTFFLDAEFEEDDLMRLAEIQREEYYINMAIAWYYSFALIKQYDAAIRLFENRTLTPWIQNKSIQKAIESYRLTPETKAYLRTLKSKERKEREKIETRKGE